MLKSLVEFCLSRRAMVLAVLVMFFGAGVVAFHRLNIEAYPDPSPPMMEIITQNPGASAEEIERYITIPIEVAVAGMPGLQHVRSISLYGLSDIRVQFSYDTDYYFAQQQTLNRLSTLPSLPNNAQPSLSPESAVGEVYRYQLVGPPGYSLIELKTLQDWVLRRRFKTIPGVIDLVAWGGQTKEYHVDVDLNRLNAYNVTLPQVITAIGNSNINVGARTINIGEQAANVRGLGLIESLDDIGNTVLNQSGGTPVLLRDVATAEIGYTPRLGIAGRDGNADIAEGIVLMRRGEKTTDVIRRIEEEVQRINRGGVLPAGVTIQPYYDRRELIDVTTHTVLHNLLFGVALVFVIQWMFLGDLRSAVVVATTIPFALFFSTIVLVLRGDSANLLSVGAIDFGIIVDSTVIMVENIFRHLREHHRTVSPRAERLAVSTLHGKLRTVLLSAVEVDHAIFFSAAITIAAFIPLFTMQGVEGQIFAPMAKTYGYALIGALVATFTISPVLSSLLLPSRTTERETIVVRYIRVGYTWLLTRAMRYRAATLGGAASLLVITAIVAPRLGTEFLPKLEEGNLWIRATLPATISLEAAEPYVARVREILRGFPEVITVVSQHGRPDDGTDPSGFYNAEFFAPLKPFDRWPRGVTKDKLVAQMAARLQQEFTGIDFNFSQNIEDNVEEAVSGVKGENSAKLFGPDLATLEQKGRQIKAQLDRVRGVEDLAMFAELGQPNVVVKIDRWRSARYGLAPGDVNTVVQAAIGGQTATQVFEGERVFPLVVRLRPEYRENVDAIKRVHVASGSQPPAFIPLSDLAHVDVRAGASYIYREENRRYLPIKFSVRGRDLGSTVGEAEANVAEHVRLPDGYDVEWSGEFGELQEAKRRLAVIVPLSLLLILVLLYSTFNSLRQSLLALSGIPLAVCGGLLALYLSGTNLSVSAAVGFISIFGVSVMDGILMLTYYNQLHQGGVSRNEALTQAAEVRMRPRLMTALSACIGLLPAAVSTGIGSQVQRPLAVVVVGGMLLVPVLISWMFPVLLSVLLPGDRLRPLPPPPPDTTPPAHEPRERAHE
jgi:heavy metal efflux system protein